MRVVQEQYVLDVPEAGNLGEANALLKAYAHKLATSTAMLREVLNEAHAMAENLESTQERCTELLLENRNIRALYANAVGNDPPCA